MLKAKVHSAKVMDYQGIKTLLRKADERFPRLSHLWLDAGYRGEDEGAEWVEKTLGRSVDLVECPRKPTPQRGADGVDQRVNQRGRGARLAEAVAPQRLCGTPSQVGGGADDRLDRAEQEDELMDYERLTATSEAFIYVAMTRVMVRRLARAR